MSVRLTKKKQKQILSHLNQIVMLYRGKIYVTLGGPDPARIDRTTYEELVRLLVSLNGQLVREILPMLETVLESDAPILPLN